MSDLTRLNTEINSTVINNEIHVSDATLINTETAGNADIPQGTVIFGKYRILRKMSENSAEAVIYLCEYQGREYAVKIYSRQNAVKPQVISALQKIDSKYIARLEESGEINGKTAEVMQYFKNGSTAGRKFSFEELKNHVIPCINEGLKVLHGSGIIHKDLKPSNIMIADDGKSVAVIDFGISSVEQDGNTVILTRTGMTPEYSAPETFRGLFLEESDYYSFGISLYEMFCGETPYRNLSAEQIAQYTAIQKIPFPDSFPDELKDLINALTYYDITNRNDTDNPNRRWTYSEVKKWLDGVKQSIPGEIQTGSGIPAYRFMNRDYRNVSDLTKALSAFWKEGKKQLFRGLMSGFFKNFNPEIAGYCIDAEESAKDGSEDLIFFRLLYKINPDMVSFEWRGRSFENLASLGREIINVLNSGESTDYLQSVLENRVLSEYLSCVAQSTPEQKNAVETIENNYRISSDSERQKSIALYLAGFLLSGEKNLTVNGRKFADTNELMSHMSVLLDSSYSEFEKFCNYISDDDGNPTAQLESWLIALGKEKQLSEWKNTDS